MSRQHVRLRSPADAVFLRVAAKLALRWTASPKTNGAVAGISGELHLDEAAWRMASASGGNMESTTKGWGSGLLGVIIFSGSLPATRVAVGDLSPIFLTAARATIAATLGLALLWALRQKRPVRNDFGSLAVVALGVVVGFPLLTALALQHITSARSMVFIGLLPLATAVFGVLRGGERPKPAFWLFSVLGGLLVAGFAL
jgi:drug/metabolite transporter (DMT)-like permease